MYLEFYKARNERWDGADSQRNKAEDFPELMKGTVLQVQEARSQAGLKTGWGRTPKTK